MTITNHQIVAFNEINIYFEFEAFISSGWLVKRARGEQLAVCPASDFHTHFCFYRRMILGDGIDRLWIAKAA